MLSDCPQLPFRNAPTSITDLRPQVPLAHPTFSFLFFLPQDVKVVGAVGDSVSTGRNAERFFFLFMEIQCSLTKALFSSTSWFNMKDYKSQGTFFVKIIEPMIEIFRPKLGALVARMG